MGGSETLAFSVVKAIEKYKHGLTSTGLKGIDPTGEKRRILQ